MNIEELKTPWAYDVCLFYVDNFYTVSNWLIIYSVSCHFEWKKLFMSLLMSIESRAINHRVRQKC